MVKISSPPSLAESHIGKLLANNAFDLLERQIKRPHSLNWLALAGLSRKGELGAIAKI